MVNVPGTVSKILWHFTGGPTWNEKDSHQERRPKSAAAAFGALVGILTSREIRLGRYKEVVKVRVRGTAYDPQTLKSRQRNILLTLRSAAVCCLADIPIAHLSYHANRYGKFALGFHRDAVMKHGFNPVLYTLHHSHVMNTIHNGFAHVEYLDLDYLRAVVEDSSPYEERLSLEAEADSIETNIAAVRDSIRHFLAFVKTFDRREFQTIYSEREWRSVQAYRFTYADVAMIVVPKRVGQIQYFQRFVDTIRTQLDLPGSVPVVPWEDLVES